MSIIVDLFRGAKFADGLKKGIIHADIIPFFANKWCFGLKDVKTNGSRINTEGKHILVISEDEINHKRLFFSSLRRFRE